MALAAVLAVVFWSHDGRLVTALERLPGLPDLYDRVFLTEPYWLLVLVGLGLLGVGWRPRPLGFGLALLLAPLALLGGGQLSRHVLLVTLLFFSLLRSDTRLSLRTWRGGSLAASAGPMWPMRLIQLQLSLLYGVNALVKTTPAYLSGDVLIGLSRMLPNFRLDLADGFLHLGSLAVPVWLLACATVATEWLLAVGFWFRSLRPAIALLGVAFHVVVRFAITIFALDLASVFLYLAFLLPFDRAPAARDPGVDPALKEGLHPRDVPRS